MQCGANQMESRTGWETRNVRSSKTFKRLEHRISEEFLNFKFLYFLLWNLVVKVAGVFFDLVTKHCVQYVTGS